MLWGGGLSSLLSRKQGHQLSVRTHIQHTLCFVKTCEHTLLGTVIIQFILSPVHLYSSMLLQCICWAYTLLGPVVLLWGGGCQVCIAGSKDPNNQFVNIYSKHFALTSYTTGVARSSLHSREQGPQSSVRTHIQKKLFRNSLEVVIVQLYTTWRHPGIRFVYETSISVRGLKWWRWRRRKIAMYRPRPVVPTRDVVKISISSIPNSSLISTFRIRVEWFIYLFIYVKQTHNRKYKTLCLGTGYSPEGRHRALCSPSGPWSSSSFLSHIFSNFQDLLKVTHKIHVIIEDFCPPSRVHRLGTKLCVTRSLNSCSHHISKVQLHILDLISGLILHPSA